MRHKPFSRRIELPEEVRGPDRPAFVDVRLVWDPTAFNLARSVLCSEFAEDANWGMVPALLEECFTNPPWEDRDTLTPLIQRDPELLRWLLQIAREALEEAVVQTCQPVITIT